MSVLKSIKIFGSGSIGNHLAHAARSLDIDVDVIDIDPVALDRMRNEIYPARYGHWDDQINLYLSGSEPAERQYDLIIIGTPPDTHMELAKIALNELPKAILIEKPICGPLELEDLRKVTELAIRNGIRLFCGYDHSVSPSIEKLVQLCGRFSRDDLMSIDVEWREYWGGILAAHPWLNGPADSYLGFWRRGGGALCEHSHGLHLLVYLSSVLGLGSCMNVASNLDLFNDSVCEYDRTAHLSLTFESGVEVNCVQDVITFPPMKRVSIKFKSIELNWSVNSGGEFDEVAVVDNGTVTESFRFEKRRPDDFIGELMHIDSVLGSQLVAESPLDIAFGSEVMELISGSFASV